MSTKSNQNDQPKKEFESKRLQAEIEKLRFEARRIELDCLQLEKPWFKKYHFFQTLLAAFVAVPLIWFYVTEIAIPLYNKENIQLSWRNEVVSDSLKWARKELAKQKADFDNQVKAMTARLDSTISFKQKELRLITVKLEEAESKDQVNREGIKSLEAQISRLKKDIKNMKSEKEQIRTIAPAYLSSDAVSAMLREKNYHDSRRNTSVSGTANKFELQQGGNIVYDAATGLSWQQSGSLGVITYPKAKEYINELNIRKFSGYNDWRLPTLEEGMSLMEPKPSRDRLRIESVFDKKQREIWTSTTYSPSGTWYIDFHFGYCNLNYDSDGLNYYYVRAVR